MKKRTKPRPGGIEDLASESLKRVSSSMESCMWKEDAKRRDDKAPTESKSIDGDLKGRARTYPEG